MGNTGIKNRIIALLLIGMMALSMTGYAFESVYAETSEEPAADKNGSTEEVITEDSEGPSETLPAEEVSPAAETPADTEEDAVQTSGSEQGGGEQVTPGEIILNAVGEDNTIQVAWKPFTSDKYTDIYYKVFLDDEAKTGELRVCSCSLSDVSAENHTVTVRAYVRKTVEPTEQGQTEAGTEEVLIAEGSFNYEYAAGRNRLSGIGQLGAANLGINLKELLGEGHSGYSIVQGGCTDGTYNYYLMVSSSTQDGRILKLDKNNNAVVGRSGVIDIEHGNGMCLDTKNNRLVISNREGYKHKLITVDTGTLSSVGYYDVNDYSAIYEKSSTSGRGIAAISYVEKYDCFIALQRTGHDLLVLDQNFKVIAFICTTITNAYPGTYQAMDADGRYVYLLQSYYDKQQPYNQILVLDWNAENLGINYVWSCNSNGSGTPDAVLRINSPYEAENIYHIDRGNGTADFYLSEYFNNQKTETITKQETYKVKWKKVWKKVPVQKKYKKKVKWKKVQKKNGKWKWKYKKVTKYKTVYKKKKVWKYKTKTRTVKVKNTYFNRDDYVYYIGTF